MTDHSFVGFCETISDGAHSIPFDTGALRRWQARQPSIREAHLDRLRKRLGPGDKRLEMVDELKQLRRARRKSVAIGRLRSLSLSSRSQASQPWYIEIEGEKVTNRDHWTASLTDFIEDKFTDSENTWHHQARRLEAFLSFAQESIARRGIQHRVALSLLDWAIMSGNPGSSDGTGGTTYGMLQGLPLFVRLWTVDMFNAILDFTISENPLTWMDVVLIGLVKNKGKFTWDDSRWIGKTSVISQVWCRVLLVLKRRSVAPSICPHGRLHQDLRRWPGHGDGSRLLEARSTLARPGALHRAGGTFTMRSAISAWATGATPFSFRTRTPWLRTTFWKPFPINWSPHRWRAATKRLHAVWRVA